MVKMIRPKVIKDIGFSIDYMISKGIAADRLKPVGYGQDQPLVPNTTQENKAKNRRVEANILK